MKKEKRVVIRRGTWKSILDFDLFFLKSLFKKEAIVFVSWLDVREKRTGESICSYNPETNCFYNLLDRTEIPFSDVLMFSLGPEIKIKKYIL